MRHSRTPWLLRRCSALPLALGLVAVAGGGCVTRGHHQEVVAELEDEKQVLEERVRELERSNRSLGDERVRLLEEMEDLRQSRQTLASDVSQLERSRDLLTTHLREREEELAARRDEVQRLQNTYQGLVSDLESELAEGQIQIEQLREGLLLNLPQDVLFRSGSANLDARGADVLRKVAGQLIDSPHLVEVQGHSDNVPLSRSLAARYGSNWELAGARAAQVVRILASAGVDPARLSAISHGEYAPVASNDTAAGRAENRRIEIRLIPPPPTANADAP